MTAGAKLAPDLRQRIIADPSLLLDGFLIVAVRGERPIGEVVKWDAPDTDAQYRGAVVDHATRQEYIAQQMRLGESRDSLRGFFTRLYHFYRVHFD